MNSHLEWIVQMVGRRFLFVSHFDFNLWRFRLPVMKALLDSGNEVIAVCPTGEYTNCMIEAGIEVVPWSCDRQNFNPFREVAPIVHLRAIAAAKRPHLIHTFTLRPNILGDIASFRRPYPWIVLNSVTGLGSTLLPVNGVCRKAMKSAFTLFIRNVLREADGIVFQNQDDREEFIHSGFVKQEKTYLIRSSGVDPERFYPSESNAKKREAKRLLLGREDCVVVAMVSRLIRDKGVHEFLQAAEAVRSRHGDTIEFCLMGFIDRGNPTCVDRDELDRFVNRGLVRVFDFQDPLPLYHAADLYCLPSYREGFPNTVLEAMACGLPAITTDVPGCRETVDDGVQGLKIPARNADALIDAIDRLIEQPEVRERMGEKSREKVCTEFSVQKVVEQYLTLYETFLGADRHT